jgi:hypothetical protein
MSFANLVPQKSPRHCHHLCVLGLKLERSSTDQCHAHDNCDLVSSTVEQAPGRPHHQQGSLQLYNHPRPNIHRRVDGEKNFGELPIFRIVSASIYSGTTIFRIFRHVFVIGLEGVLGMGSDAG